MIASQGIAGFGVKTKISMTKYLRVLRQKINFNKLVAFKFPQNLLLLLFLILPAVAVNFAVIDHGSISNLNISNTWAPPLSGAIKSREDFNFKSPYYVGGHHKGEDFFIDWDGSDDMADYAKPVFAIGNGLMYVAYKHVGGREGESDPETNNLSRMFVRHEDSNGNQFVAAYGHVEPLPHFLSVCPKSAPGSGLVQSVEGTNCSGAEIRAGDLIGHIRLNNIPAHLHFGINDGVNENLNVGYGTTFQHWGSQPLSEGTAEELIDAKGWVDPISFLNSHFAYTAEQRGFASATNKMNVLNTFGFNLPIMQDISQANENISKLAALKMIISILEAIKEESLPEADHSIPDLCYRDVSFHTAASVDGALALHQQRAFCLDDASMTVIKKAVAANIIHGDRRFYPSRWINRQEMMALFVKAITSNQVNISELDLIQRPASYAPGTTADFHDFIFKAEQADIIADGLNNFSPKSPVTRAAFANWALKFTRYIVNGLDDGLKAPCYTRGFFYELLFDDPLFCVKPNNGDQVLPAYTACSANNTSQICFKCQSHGSSQEQCIKCVGTGTEESCEAVSTLVARNCFSNSISADQSLAWGCNNIEPGSSPGPNQVVCDDESSQCSDDDNDTDPPSPPPTGSIHSISAPAQVHGGDIIHIHALGQGLTQDLSFQSSLCSDWFRYNWHSTEEKTIECTVGDNLQLGNYSVAFSMQSPPSYKSLDIELVDDSVQIPDYFDPVHYDNFIKPRFIGVSTDYWYRNEDFRITLQGSNLPDNTSLTVYNNHGQSLALSEHNCLIRPESLTNRNNKSWNCNFPTTGFYWLSFKVPHPQNPNEFFSSHSLQIKERYIPPAPALPEVHNFSYGTLKPSPASIEGVLRFGETIYFHFNGNDVGRYFVRFEVDDCDYVNSGNGGSNRSFYYSCRPTRLGPITAQMYMEWYGQRYPIASYNLEVQAPFAEIHDVHLMDISTIYLAYPTAVETRRYMILGDNLTEDLEIHVDGMDPASCSMSDFDSERGTIIYECSRNYHRSLATSITSDFLDLKQDGAQLFRKDLTTENRSGYMIAPKSASVGHPSSFFVAGDFDEIKIDKCILSRNSIASVDASWRRGEIACSPLETALHKAQFFKDDLLVYEEDIDFVARGPIAETNGTRIDSVSPAEVIYENGKTINVTLNGAGLNTLDASNFDMPHCNNFTELSKTNDSYQFSCDLFARVNLRLNILYDAANQSNYAYKFVIANLEPPVEIISIVPNAVLLGRTTNMTIRGKNISNKYFELEGCQSFDLISSNFATLADQYSEAEVTYQCTHPSGQAGFNKLKIYSNQTKQVLDYEQDIEFIEPPVRSVSPRYARADRYFDINVNGQNFSDQMYLETNACQTLTSVSKSATLHQYRCLGALDLGNYTIDIYADQSKTILMHQADITLSAPPATIDSVTTSYPVVGFDMDVEVRGSWLPDSTYFWSSICQAPVNRMANDPGEDGIDKLQRFRCRVHNSYPSGNWRGDIYAGRTSHYVPIRLNPRNQTSFNYMFESLSPGTVNANEAATFTLTGHQMPRSLNMSFPACQNMQINSSSADEIVFSCDSVNLGNQTLSIINSFNQAVRSFNIRSALPSPTVDSVSYDNPAVHGIRTNFQVTFSGLSNINQHPVSLIVPGCTAMQRDNVSYPAPGIALVDYSCEPQTLGAMAASVYHAYDGYLYQFTLDVEAPPRLAPQILAVSPNQALVGQRKAFYIGTSNGQPLELNKTQVTVTNCNNLSFSTSTNSFGQQVFNTFSCTPSSAGLQQITITDTDFGHLYQGTVNVTVPIVDDCANVYYSTSCRATRGSYNNGKLETGSDIDHFIIDIPGRSYPYFWISSTGNVTATLRHQYGYQVAHFGSGSSLFQYVYLYPGRYYLELRSTNGTPADYRIFYW